jgi:hypothetical protein
VAGTDIDTNELINITSISTDDSGISSGFITTSVISDYFITDVNNNTISSVNWSNTPFEDVMPNLQHVKQMCEEYPGLAKAYENFKIAYMLVHQDWEGRNK